MAIKNLYLHAQEETKVIMVMPKSIEEWCEEVKTLVIGMHAQNYISKEKLHTNETSKY